MRRFLGWSSLLGLVLTMAGCGAAADAPKLPPADAKKLEEEFNQKQKEGMEKNIQEKAKGRPGGGQ